ncbi:S-adenosyl-L-methionine-dependent methyltransferase [Glomus cerebriforme]|uniref:S-adenosyl-L-methionine-dependent methyltransferase n=1 Tax=Glomus cerebriforme TaxID=658196 RepID=A0A397TG83_9GLOM|nr:S-adenosyl-L-methionine-dependent methyltransferase [Glomus cerebriforme]
MSGYIDEETQILSCLPPSFLQFLEINDIDPTIYTIKSLPRYVRLNTHFPSSQLPSLSDLSSQLYCNQIVKVPNIPYFFSLPSIVKIVNSLAYKQGKIFGIDLSSAVAIYSLDIQPNDHILDLCCAPGVKLCLISNLLDNDGIGTITGVDISKNRLSICKNLCKKYKIAKVRLFLEDGTKFNVFAPSYLEPIKKITGQLHELRINGNILKFSEDISEIVTPFWTPKILRNDPQERGSQYLYDKVIVDAECTHDGSISHILKYKKYGWETFEKNFLNPDRLNSLWDLQRNLLKNGWNLLKPDGILVYSTCSLSKKQNEDVIGWFLANYQNAQLETIPNIANLKTAPLKIREYNNIDLSKLVRFDPIHSNTSGFFVAKIRKVKEN